MQHRTFSKKLKKKPPTQRGGVEADNVLNTDGGIGPSDVELQLEGDAAAAKAPVAASVAAPVGDAPAASTAAASAAAAKAPESAGQEPGAPAQVAPSSVKDVSEKDALDAAKLSVSFNLSSTAPSLEQGFEIEQETWSKNLKEKLDAIKNSFQKTYIDSSNVESEIAKTLIELVSSKPKILSSLSFNNDKAFIKALEPVKGQIEDKVYEPATIDEILKIANKFTYKDDVIKKLRILKIRKELAGKEDKGKTILKKFDEISLYNLNPIQELILILKNIGLSKDDQFMRELELLYNYLRVEAIDKKILQQFQTYNLITMKNIENTNYPDWVTKDGNDYREYVKNASNSYKEDTAAYRGWLAKHNEILKNRSILARFFMVKPPSPEAAAGEAGAGEAASKPNPAAADDKKGPVGEKGEPPSPGAVAAKAAAAAAAIISPKGLSAAFNVLYDILALIGAVLVVVFFLLSVSDLVVYLLNEIKQKKFLIFDPNLFNQDTSEYKALKYNSNDTKSEPYNIYLEQNLIKQMYRVVGLFFVVIGLQIGSFLAFKLLASLKNQEFDESLEKPKNISVIVTVLTAGLVLSAYYKQKFLNTIQPVFKGTQNKMTNMKDYIYNHMTTNVEFLEALLSNNVSVLIETMAKQQTAYSLSKMLFTFSLYNYFKTNVPESDEETEEIRSIFTIQQIRTQTVDPIKYFYYRQNIFIPNMYVTLKNSLINKNCPVFRTNNVFNEEKESNFRILMNSQVLELNRGLLQLLKLPKRKRQLFLYLLMILLISSIFVIALMVMYKEQVAEVWEIIWPKLLIVWQKITSLFSSKKAA